MIAACNSATDPIGPDAHDPPQDELAGYPSVGPRDLAGFRLQLGSCDRPIAQGADASLLGEVRRTAPNVASIVSEDPTTFTVGTFMPATDLTFAVQLHAVGPGDADVVLRDSLGDEIDRIALHVRATDTLDINRAWGAGDALVLAGEVERLHVTTKTAGAVTVGTGAVSFSLAGALAAATKTDAPWFFAEGDQIYFRAGASGTGTVTASAPDATAEVTLSIIDPTALTAITVSPADVRFTAGREGNVAIGATAAGVPVYGVRCTWVAPPGLEIKLESIYGNLEHLGLQTGSIGSEPSFVYSIKGSPGMHQPVCTLPGGLSTTIPVRIE